MRLTSPGRQALLAGCLLGAALLSLIWVAISVVHRSPVSGDEFTFLYQARTMARLRLWMPAHPLQEYFDFYWVVDRSGKVFSQYLPGWPAVLTLALWARLPLWLVNPIIGTASLGLVYLLGKRIYGRRVGVIAACTVFLSAFFLLNSASFYSHPLAMCYSLAFAWFAWEFLATGGRWTAFWSGLFFGMLVLTRQYTAIWIGLPFVLYYGLTPRRWNANVGFVFLGGLPLLLLLLAFDAVLTGNPLRIPAAMLSVNSLSLGLTAPVEVTARRIAGLALYASPLLLLFYVAYLPALWRDPLKHLAGFVFLSLVVGFAFFLRSGGYGYGPRYLYEAYPFLVLFVCGMVFREGAGQRAARLFTASLVVQLVLIPFIFRHTTWFFSQREPDRIIRAAGIDHAIVLVAPFSPVGCLVDKDLVRNDLDFRNPILYAYESDSRAAARLARQYPTRSLYRLAYDPRSRHFVLTLLRNGPAS